MGTPKTTSQLTQLNKDLFRFPKAEPITAEQGNEMNQALIDSTYNKADGGVVTTSSLTQELGGAANRAPSEKAVATAIAAAAGEGGISYTDERAAQAAESGGVGDIKNWVAGPQREGQLSYSAGRSWRAKRAIENSQTAPENNPSNYEPLDGRGVVADPDVAPEFLDFNDQLNTVRLYHRGFPLSSLRYVLPGASAAQVPPADGLLQVGSQREGQVMAYVAGSSKRSYSPAFTLGNTPAGGTSAPTYTAFEKATATCPTGYTGTPVTRGAAGSSTQSLAHAQQQAYNTAAELAEAALVCTLVSAPTPPNTPPVVTFTAPTSGIALPLNTAIILTANATDDKAVTSVVFVNGLGATLGAGSKNGNTYTLPYTVTAAGPLSLTANAYDAEGLVGSATVNITVQEATPTPLPTPTGFAATPTGPTTLGTSWNPVTNATGYEVQYATNNAFTQGVGVLVVPATETAGTLTALAASTTYYSRVRARGTGSYSDSGYSAAVSATTQAAPTSSTKAQQFSDGDSLDKGYLTSNEETKNWSAQMYPLQDSTKFGAPAVIAVSGQTTNDMLSRQTVNLLNQIDRTAFGMAIVSVGGAHNDLMYGVPPAQIKANKIQYIQNVRAWQAANGNFPVKVILESITPNGKAYGSITLAQYETYRKQLNDEAFTGYSSVYGADYYNNYNADSRLNNVYDTTYYTSDRQHFTDAGQLARAQDNLPYFLAAQAGTTLAPKADVSSTTGATGNGTGYTASNLTAQALTFSDLATGVSVDASGVLLTSTANATTTGYSGGILSKFGIGPSSALVRGWIEWDIYHEDGEYVGGLLAGSPLAINNYPGITFAFHLQQTVAPKGIRPFGVGSTSTGDNVLNFADFTDGQTVRLVVEQTRIVWYVNGQQVLAMAVNDPGTYYFQVAMKGLNSKMRNVRMAAANLVDSGRPAFGAAPAAAVTSDFTAFTAGALDGQGGWTDYAGGATIDGTGLALGDNHLFSSNARGCLLAGTRQDGEVTLTVPAGGGSPMLRWHYDTATEACLAMWVYAGNFDAGIIRNKNYSAFATNATGAIGAVPAGEYCMSMRTVGNVLELRYWPVSGSRPATPQFSYTLTPSENIASGQTGLGCLTGGTKVKRLSVA